MRSLITGKQFTLGGRDGGGGGLGLVWMRAWAALGAVTLLRRGSRLPALFISGRERVEAPGAGGAG